MPIPTVTELNEGKEDLDDLESLVNGTGNVQTRLGGIKPSYSQLTSALTHGDIDAYDPTETVTLATQWRSHSGIVYRPIPSALPISPTSPLETSPNTAKWLAVQLTFDKAQERYPYRQAFIDSTPDPLTTMVWIDSFYPYGSSASPYATPKGGHFMWRTGATNTAPTVSTSPLPSASSNGTGTQAGYAWDASGAEWYIKQDQRITPMMFGATADGSNDYTPVNDALIYCQANSVNLYGDRSNTHTINSTINITVANTEIYGLRLVASATMEALLKITSGIDGVKIAYCNLDCNCSTPDNQNITADGAERGIYGVNCDNSRIYRNTIYDYRTAGVHLHLTSAGTQMIDNKVFKNTISGIESLVITSVRATAGVRVQNEYDATASAETDIAALDYTDTYRSRNNDVYSNTIRKSRYCIDMVMSEACNIYDNDMQYCTRAVSVQHVCDQVAVYKNKVKFYESVGIHFAYGTRASSVNDNRIKGTGHLDSSAIQFYYGVYDSSITNNKADSEFDLYDGSHINNTVTAPENGIRVGQYCTGVKVGGNTVIGFRRGIAIKSTIYESTITSMDVNYYNTGFRDVKVFQNTIKADYVLASTTGVRAAMPLNTIYGILITKSGGWEDTAQGSLNLDNVQLSNNTVEDAGYNYVLQDAGVTGSNRPTWSEVIVSENSSLNAGLTTYTASSLVDAPGSVRAMNNSWQNKEAYTVTNLVDDRTYNADSTTTAELADILGTLIKDLRANGIVN